MYRIVHLCGLRACICPLAGQNPRMSLVIHSGSGPESQTMGFRGKREMEGASKTWGILKQRALR